MTHLHNLIRDEYERLLYGHVAIHHGFPRPGHIAGSDILLHLPVLEYLGSIVETIVEFGVRDGHSTLAFLAGLSGVTKKPSSSRVLHSFDIELTPFVNRILSVSPLPVQWNFQVLDTGDQASAHLVPEADLFFIDTLHTAEHVRKELRLHGHKAKQYIAFHDTSTCGEYDLSGPNPGAIGILPAIREFLAENPEWRVFYRSELCNGLLVLAHKSALWGYFRA